MSIVKNIKDAVVISLNELYEGEFSEANFQINQTKPEFEGDYTIVLFTLVKSLKKSPDEIGEQLGDFLIKNPNHIHLIINEAFAFVNTFKKYNFIHGNLHIDNIYINIQDMYQFFVIDLCNSYYSNSCSNSHSNNAIDVTFKRKSFIDVNKNILEHDKFKDKYCDFWDFICLFFSLNIYFENNKNHLNYIKESVTNYINKDKVNDILHYYTYNLNNDEYYRIRKKYHSLLLY